MTELKNSDGWFKLRRIIDDKIEKAIGQLELPSDIDRTNLLRGELGAYRQLIRDVEEDRSNHPGQPVSYGQ